MLHRMVIAALLTGCGTPGTALAACKIGKLADLPVTMIDRKPMVSAQINGQDVLLVADSGAFYSTLSPASAAQLKLRTGPAPYGLSVTGVGGEAKMSVATVKSFNLAGIPIHDIEFLVGGGDVGGNAAGLLGQNVFRIGDVEYDLARGIIRLMHEEDCGKTVLAYWVTNKADPYSVIDIHWTTPLEPGTTGAAYVNGVKIRVLFDTGADTSMLSAHAAERAGIKVDGPDVVYAGYSRGIGRAMLKTWIAPVAVFKIGDEEVRHTHLRISEAVTDSADMLIGTDFFLSHRIYVASKQSKLFFTYNGGPVFNLSVSHADAPAPPGTDAGAGEAAAAGSGAGAGVAPGAPQTAEAFSRRGAASAARHDFDHAIADLSRACDLAPDHADYFYERGVMYRDDHRRAEALADFDRTLVLKPDHVPALVARAEERLSDGDAIHGIADLDTADRVAAKEADARLRMASAYAHADRLAAARTQLDLWIAAHEADSRLGPARGQRCWVAALSGQDLPKALDDCNAALRQIGKKNADAAWVFNARGLVRLRLGDYARSTDDYRTSLDLNPNDAWALYGRGIDELREGKSGGRDDLAAAAALWRPIAEAFEKHGIVP